ncbi:hypothetical protein RSAG8_07825, partial [Rhizoctonia solani AG-8 WAC10335]
MGVNPIAIGWALWCNVDGHMRRTIDLGPEDSKRYTKPHSISISPTTFCPRGTEIISAVACSNREILFLTSIGALGAHQRCLNSLCDSGV